MNVKPDAFPDVAVGSHCFAKTHADLKIADRARKATVFVQGVAGGILESRTSVADGEKYGVEWKCRALT